jgi:cell division transport system ATP-binding protein
MITLDRVSKVYAKSHKPALDNVTLFIAPKEFAIIVGASGAGKSTLLKLLTREEKQTSGKIIVGGIDYDALDDRDIPLLRRRIGVVFQDFKLLPNRTVYENIALSLESSGHSNRQIRENVPKILELVGLRGKEKSFPRELSGGERQRVAIARAMVRQPKILIADEPTGNLDPKNSMEIVKLLQKINKFGTTVLLITHSMDIVNMLGKRVIALDDGRIIRDVAKGTFKNVGGQNNG